MYGFHCGHFLHHCNYGLYLQTQNVKQIDGKLFAYPTFVAHAKSLPSLCLTVYRQN